MKKDYVTVKSNFHGNGVYSRHSTGELAAKAAAKWNSAPGLAVAVYGEDGNLYQQEYQRNAYGDFELVWQSPDPIKTIQARGSYASAREYLVFESDLRTAIGV